MASYKQFLYSTTVHVTDLHCGYDNIKKLKEKLKNDKLTFDMVLISGDVANVPLDQYHTASKELLQEHHDILVRITEDFRSVAEKVYFIPGNVSGCMYSDPIRSTPLFSGDPD